MPRGSNTQFRTGDRIYDETDPRHIGRVEKIWHWWKLRVRWDDTGWIGEVRIADARLYERAGPRFAAAAPCPPRPQGDQSKKRD